MNKIKQLALSLIFLASAITTYSATYYSRVSGNWTAPATWSTVSCGGVAALSAPGSGDDVIICTGHTITMNGNPGACLSLTLNGSAIATWTTTQTTNVGVGGLTMSSTSSLTGTSIGVLNVAGAFNVASGASSTVGGITLSVTGATTLAGTLNFNSTSGTKTFSSLNVNSGGIFNSTSTETYTVSSDLTLNGTGSITGSATGVLNVLGNCSVPTGANATMGRVTVSISGTTTLTGTLNCNNTTGNKNFYHLVMNSGSAFNSSVAETYAISGNLTMTGASIAGTSTGIYTVTGAFNVMSGSSSYNGGNLTVTGSTTINGTLSIGNVTGTKTFGNFTISSGGTFTNSVNEAITISGNFQNDGTFTSGTGIYTLSGASKTITGASNTTFTNLTCSGTYTNNIDITRSLSVTTGFAGAGTFTQGAGRTLYIGATSVTPTLVANAADNIVDYNSTGAQTIKLASGNTYSYLRTSGGSGVKTLGGATTVIKDVLIGNGTTLAAANFNFTLRGNFTNNGTFTTTTGTSIVTFNGTAAQTINGTTATTFKNVTLSNTTAAIAATTNFSVSGTLSVSTGAVLNPDPTVVISGAGTLNGTGEVRVTRIAATPDMSSQYSITTKTLTGMNVKYIGAGDQTISALNYGTLTVASNGTRTVTLASTGTVGIAVSFVPDLTTTSYVFTGSTVNYNGSVSQNILAFDYNNLTSSSTGARVLASSGTIGIAGAFTQGTNAYTTTGSTINFNGSGAQTIPLFTFNNVIVGGSGTKTLSGAMTVNGNITISSTLDVSATNYAIVARGNWLNNGTLTPRSGTVTFSGTTAIQTISGSSSTTFTNLTISNTAYVINPTTAFSVSGTLNITANAVLSPDPSVIISGAGTLTGSGEVRVTRTAATADFLSQYSITGRTLTNLTVNYSGAGDQSVNALNYGKLTFTTNGTRVITLPAGTVGISGIFTPTSTTTTYVNTGNTIDFNGTAAQTIPAFNYNNLTSSSSGARTLASSGTIGIAGVFTKGTNAYTITGSTIDYNGSASQNITIFNYNNLTCSSTGDRVLPVGAVGIAGTFTKGTNAYTVTGGTITFNGAGAQTIPAFTFYNLTVAGSGTKTLGGAITVDNDLTISSTLDVSVSNYAINVKNNWTNNGTFTPQNGTVTFDGSGVTAQTLSGTGSTTFENLVINNTGGGVQLSSGTYLITGALTPTDGDFNANGQSITLVSTASKTARISEITGGTLTGSFTVQRHIGTRTPAWACLSSPVAASTMADWDNELFLYYPFASANVYAYNESTANYTAVTAATTLSPGQGFEIFLCDDATLTAFSNTTLTTVGTPNQGTQNFPLGYTIAMSPYEGQNLMGNPFASSISWDDVFAASSNILNSFDVYDYTTGNYSTGGAGDELAAGQGFWVYATSGGASLNIPESAKTATNNNGIRSAGTINNKYFTLKLKSDNSSFAHSLKIAADPTASNDWDTKDHPFRKSLNKNAPSITSKISKSELSINTFNSSAENYTMPLTTKTGISGSYTINATGIENMSAYNCIVLEDKLTHKTIDLTQNNSYTFNMNVDDNENRFVLHFNNNQNCNAATASINVNSLTESVNIKATQVGNNVIFTGLNNASAVISVVNMLGQNIIENKNVVANSQTEEIVLPNDFHGMYMIRVQLENEVIVNKFFKN